MKSKIRFLILITNLIIISIVGCIDEFNSDSFKILNYNTISGNEYITHIRIEFSSDIDEGLAEIYDPSGKLSDSKFFMGYDNNITLFIGGLNNIKPKIGVYNISIFDNKSIPMRKIFESNLLINDSLILITSCIPKWVYNEVFDYFTFKSVNLTMKNSGDISGFIYEGRIILNNNSIFIAPDYHWHDINLWIKPDEEVSVDLPVEIPWLDGGSHFIQIYMQDLRINTIGFYENIIFTP